MSNSALESTSVSALQRDLSEVERDLTLRKLLWESMSEWETLVNQWKFTAFDAIVVEELQKDVTRFIQTIFLLEKGRVRVHIAHNEGISIIDMIYIFVYPF